MWRFSVKLLARPMFPATFQNMGIPASYAFKQLLFSPVAEALRWV
jgi:hypothetical protein